MASQKFAKRFATLDGDRLVVICAGVFFVVVLGLALHRHFTFYSSYDQGIFNQVFWNGVRGNFFESTLSSQLSTNVVHSGEVPAVDYRRLGQHFTPALLLWHPLYALFPFPATLTVLQVTLVTLAGLVLYRLGRLYLEPPIAAFISASFYGATAIVGPTLANFHDIAQIPLLAFSLLLAMEKRCWWAFAGLAVLLLAVREDSGITLFGIGAYMLLSRRFPRAGLATCVTSFGYMLLLTNAIMPLFSEDISKRFMLERFGQYVEGDEATTLDVIGAMARQPWLLAVELVTPVGRTVNYLLGQLLPFAFVPAGSPAAWAIAGFPLLKLLLGKGESVLAITIRYAMSVVPGLCYGAILWWAGQDFGRLGKSTWNQSRRLRPGFRRFWTVCIALSLLFAVTANPNRALYFVVPDSVEPWVYVSLPQQWARSRQIYALLDRIPPDASVAATTYLIPHVSGRREVIRLPALAIRTDAGTVENVEYAIADLWRLERYRVAFDHDRALLEANAQRIAEMAAGDYGIIGFENGLVLLQRGVPSEPEALAGWEAYLPAIATSPS